MYVYTLELKCTIRLSRKAIPVISVNKLNELTKAYPELAGFISYKAQQQATYIN